MAAAMGEHAAAKISVWWDIENCHVPRSCDPHRIAQNMSSALVAAGYTGPITISAYGDTSCVPHHVQRALSSTGITLNHVPAGIKAASDKKILVDMLIWAIDNPPPANYLLISGDRDFSNALHKLKMRQYNILLAQPPNVSQALTAAAKSVWLWKSFVAGEPQLAESPYISSTANGSVDDLDVSQNMVSDSSGITPNAKNSIQFDQQKAGNGKVDKQHKVWQPRKNQTDNVSKPVSNEETSVHGVADNSIVSTASNPNDSRNSSPSSLPSPELHDGTKVTPKIEPFSLSQKHAKSAHSNQKSAPHDFYHGKKPGVSTESAPKNGAPDFGTGTSHCHPKYQRPQSSQPPRPQNPVNHRPRSESSNFQASNSHRSNSGSIRISTTSLHHSRRHRLGSSQASGQGQSRPHAPPRQWRLRLPEEIPPCGTTTQPVLELRRRCAPWFSTSLQDHPIIPAKVMAEEAIWLT